MKLFLFICLATLFASSYGWAQTADDELLLPPSSCVFSGDFKQSKHLKGLPAPIESSGQFFYHCDLGVIWKTISPIEETLVLTNIGESFIIENNQSKPLKSQQSKLLSELINGLMGANQQYINENFQIRKQSITTAEAFTLIPKKRRLKRGLKQIDLSFAAESLSSNSEEVLISILDRNKQWTHIKSTKYTDYSSNLLDNSLNLIEQCSTSAAFSKYECQLLFQSCQKPPFEKPQ